MDRASAHEEVERLMTEEASKLLPGTRHQLDARDFHQRRLSEHLGVHLCRSVELVTSLLRGVMVDSLSASVINLVLEVWGRRCGWPYRVWLEHANGTAIEEA